MSPVNSGSSASIAARSGRRIGGGDHLALGVVGVGLLAPAHGEAVDLAAVLDEGNRLGGFAERDRQNAGGERVERAGMADLGRAEEPLHRGHRLGRGLAGGLVEAEPAGNLAALLLAVGPSVPRFVLGRIFVGGQMVGAAEIAG